MKSQLFYLALLLAMTVSHVRAFEFFQPLAPARRCQVMAHRGQMHQAPENTGPGIEHAIRDLLEWVEVDVRRSRDGHHVLLHDATVDRTTNGSGSVTDKTLSELKQLDAGAPFAPRFAGTQILTLPECLELAKGRINLYLDCKQIEPEQLVSEIVAAQMQNQVVVFDSLETLQEIRDLSGGAIAVMAKWRASDGRDAPWLDALRPAIVEIDAPEVSADVCRRFHARGIQVQAKSLVPWDNPGAWDHILKSGADYVQTDRPEEFVAHDFFQRIRQPPVQFALHRGASRYAPENTAPALSKAVQLRSNYVEIDVRTSADGELLLLHDATLDRCTNATGPIVRYTTGQVRSLDAGSWFSREFVDTRLLDLDSALRILQSKAACYFDAKALEPLRLVNSLRAHDMLDRSVIFQSPKYLQQVRSLEPRARIMPPLYRSDDLDRAIEELHPYAFDVKWEILSPDLIERCHSAGVKVFSDAIGKFDHCQQHREKIAWGIDVIQTDHPLHVIRAMELQMTEH